MWEYPVQLIKLSIIGLYAQLTVDPNGAGYRLYAKMWQVKKPK